MVGLLRALSVLAALPVLTAPAHGFGWYGHRTSYYYYPAYYAVPTVYYYTPVYVTTTPATCTMTVPVASPYAVPSAAPPSSQEPPLKKDGGPKVSESRSSFRSSYYVATNNSDRCRVGFWNLTGHDVTVTVGGQAHFIPRDRSVTLDLAREFRWRFDRHDPQVTRVPGDRSTFEILLRD